jgi:hypothetical protein
MPIRISFFLCENIFYTVFVCDRSRTYQCCGSALVYLSANSDPDPGSQTNADPGPGQTLKSQKAEFLHEKST